MKNLIRKIIGKTLHNSLKEAGFSERRFAKIYPVEIVTTDKTASYLDKVKYSKEDLADLGSQIVSAFGYEWNF